eukprot:1811435-Rhodomonas_salina.3
MPPRRGGSHGPATSDCAVPSPTASPLPEMIGSCSHLSDHWCLPVPASNTTVPRIASVVLPKRSAGPRNTEHVTNPNTCRGYTVATDLCVGAPAERAAALSRPASWRRSAFAASTRTCPRP